MTPRLTTFAAERIAARQRRILAVIIIVAIACSLAFTIGAAIGRHGADESAELARRAVAQAEESSMTAAIAIGEAAGWKQIAEDASDTVETLEAENDAIQGDLEAALKELSVWKARAKAAENRSRQIPLSSSGRGWQSARASWYGSKFYGHTMAGGGTYGPKVMGVAHKSLPFGTRIQISYKGRTVTVPVVDRGPYTPGRTFDLTYATAQALGFSGVGTVKWRIVA